ncbi:MAG: O-antigen polymerase, partial [Solirubrobacterales bacterium]|nr:O-antigen polymerase [Solirubrobacterales bacterium]
MSLEVRVALSLMVAAAAAYVLTPVAIRLAARFEFYDKPAGYKGHARPTPYLGGAAVVAGFCAVLLVFAIGEADRTLPLIGGMALLWVVGTVDDRTNLSPWVRVAVELGLAIFLWGLDLGWNTGLGPGVDLLLTALWLVAVINAFNLFDNMDGAASTMALVASACVAALAAVHGDHWLIVAAAVLVGTCLGFLPHNLARPARIFLGDGGSMPLGFAVATLAMIGAAEAAPSGQSLILGLLLVGVPATDTALVIFSRRRRGISVLTGGRDHLTHRTHQWFRTARAVALALGAVQALVSVTAVFAISGGGTAILVVAVLFLVAAATAIAFLETRYEEDPMTEPATAPAAEPAPRTAGPRPGRTAHAAVVVVFGAVCGMSAFWSGFYSSHQWVPIGLVLLVFGTAAAVARTPRLTRPAIGLLSAVAGMAVFALLSATWAPSIAQATNDANRWFVLAAVTGTALVLVRGRVSAAWLTAGLAAGLALLAAYVGIRMMGSDGGNLFLNGRLNEPLGYINAEATAFLMGFWLWFAMIEHRPGLRSGIALGMATIMAGLVLMSQSRGAALALAASLLVVALLPGGRVRRLYAVLAVAAGVVVASGPILHLYREPNGPPVDFQTAGLALLAAAIAVGALWWAAERGIAAWNTSEQRALTVQSTGKGILIALAVVVAAVGLVSAGRVKSFTSTQWKAFTTLAEPAGTTDGSQTIHLVSGGGTRYDYWRIAWHSFEDKPLGGEGAGNYDRPYFRARATTEDVRQPHSMELQALSELGIVGGGLILLLIVCLGLGLARARRWMAVSATDRALAVAGAGAVSAWLIHTSVDWIHLIPGVTAIALGMAAVLVRPGQPVPPGAPAPAPAPVPS